MNFRRSLPAMFLAGLLAVVLPAGAAVTASVPAPSLDARSYVLMDYQTGMVMAEKNADDKVEPASLTKIMTIYAVGHALAEDMIKLDDLVTVSEKAWKAEGSRMFIEVGKQVPVSELIDGIIIQSGNDACIALAEHVSGTEGTFADVMNGLPTMRQRAEEGERLMACCFREFENVTLFQPTDVVENAQVWLGASPTVPLVGGRELVVTLPRNWRGKAVISVKYEGPIKAPVIKGSRVGVLTLSGPGVPSMEVPLIAGADVPQLGISGRAMAVLTRMLTRGG